jgi:polyisoprenoid-binding protein YceI
MIRLVPLFIALSLGVGCSKEERAAIGMPELPKAEIYEAAPAPAPVAGAKELQIDQASSKVSFVGYNVTSSQTGSFKSFSGMLSASSNDPTSVSATLSIDLDSLETAQGDLTKHLKSKDFFDVPTHPKATFTTTKITPGGTAGATHTVEGNFQLRGVTKVIRFPAKFDVTDTKGTMSAKFLLDRQPFGVAYQGAPDNLVRDLVVIELNITASPK